MPPHETKQKQCSFLPVIWNGVSQVYWIISSTFTHWNINLHFSWTTARINVPLPDLQRCFRFTNSDEIINVSLAPRRSPVCFGSRYTNRDVYLYVYSVSSGSRLILLCIVSVLFMQVKKKCTLAHKILCILLVILFKLKKVH